MELVTGTAAAVPQWKGIELGRVRLKEGPGSWSVPFKAKQLVGDAQGYSSYESALSAAQLLSKGPDQHAVAVTADGGLFRVWSLDLNDKASFGHGRTYTFAFEAGLPASLGKDVELRPGAVRDAVTSLAAVVDGDTFFPLA